MGKHWWYLSVVAAMAASAACGTTVVSSSPVGAGGAGGAGATSTSTGAAASTAAPASGGSGPTDETARLVELPTFHRIEDLAAAPDGGLYVAVRGDGMTRLGDASFTSFDGTMIAHIDAQGSTSWTVPVPLESETLHTVRFRLAATADGVVVGVHMSEDEHAVGSAWGVPPESDIVVAKYDRDGTRLWAWGSGNVSDHAVFQLPQLTVDADGNTYLGGRHDLPSPALPSAAPEGSVLASLDPTGAVRWVRGIDGGLTSEGRRVAVVQDDVCVLAQSTVSVDWGAGPMAPIDEESDAIIGCFARADGALRWVQRYGCLDSSCNLSRQEVHAHSGGLMLMQDTALQLGVTHAPTPAPSLSFAAFKFSEAEPQWATPSLGPGPRAMAVLEDGSALLVGRTAPGQLDAGLPSEAVETSEPLLIGVNANGKLAYVGALGSHTHGWATVVAAEPSGGAFIGGRVEDPGFEAFGVSMDDRGGFIVFAPKSALVDLMGPQ